MNQFHELARRMRPVHHAWQVAVADLTLAQVNHHERAGVLPISFTVMHLVNTEDFRSCASVTGQEPLWRSGGWAERVGVTVPSVMRGTPMEVAETLRFADIDAWREYQSAVFSQTRTLLAEVDPARWDEVYLESVPASMHGGFLHHLVGDEPVRLSDYLDVVVYHHAIRHLGELEHARALVGLGGVGG